MNPKIIDLERVHLQLHAFIKRHGCKPTMIFLPALTDQKKAKIIGEVLGVRVVYGLVDEPEFALT